MPLKSLLLGPSATPWRKGLLSLQRNVRGGKVNIVKNSQFFAQNSGPVKNLIWLFPNFEFQKSGASAPPAIIKMHCAYGTGPNVNFVVDPQNLA